LKEQKVFGKNTQSLQLSLAGLVDKHTKAKSALNKSSILPLAIGGITGDNPLRMSNNRVGAIFALARWSFWPTILSY
jgi:hypothetical protein